MKIDVFISYHTESSRNIVEAIVNNLESNGVRCWYAPRDIEGNYAGSIKRAIDKSAVFLLILNKLATESQHVLNEVDIAFANPNIAILPFHVADKKSDMSDDANYYLGRIHWIDGMTPALTERIKDLSVRIFNILGKTIPLDSIEDIENHNETAESNVSHFEISKNNTKQEFEVTEEPKTSNDTLDLDAQNVKDEIGHKCDASLSITPSIAFEFRNCYDGYSIKRSTKHIPADVVIPHEYKGRPVVAIDPSAFSHNCQHLTSIVIPNSVKTIGSMAFYNCTSLTSVSLPENINILESQTFDGCKSLTKVLIPSSVNYIGKGAFKNCISLTSIDVPEGVNSIEEDTFWGCGSLQNIRFPTKLKSIEDSAFAFCTALSDIVIPDGVTSIGYEAFNRCRSLKTITLPKSVSVIKPSAFHGCSSLTDIYCKVSRVPNGWSQYWLGNQSCATIHLNVK